MKEYQYISDSKVDVILPQIPLATRQKVSAEIGVSVNAIFGKVSAKFKTEKPALDDRVSRLRAVSAFIAADQKLGTIQAPENWIADTVTAKVGFFADDTKIIGFAGVSDNTHFLLVGSSAHIIGTDPKDATIGHGFSFLPRLRSRLTDVLRYSDDDGLKDEDYQSYLGGDKFDTKEGYWRKVIEKSRYDLSGDPMRIEFLARQLLFTEGNRGRYLLGTPLYVALAT